VRERRTPYLHLFRGYFRCIIEVCIQKRERERGTPYKGLRPRVANNEYNNPNRDYFYVASNLQLFDDSAIDKHLGPVRMSRPSIRVCVKNLFLGGHYDPRTITCRNVEAKDDGAPCVVMSCKCMSSKSSVLHTVYAVFEDKPNGDYLKELSSCSCKKGEEFCSHSIGFLYLMHTPTALAHFVFSRH
jgi:hypothetical protein